jgi:hypothetical protein
MKFQIVFQYCITYMLQHWLLKLRKYSTRWVPLSLHNYYRKMQMVNDSACHIYWYLQENVTGCTRKLIKWEQKSSLTPDIPFFIQLLLFNLNDIKTNSLAFSTQANYTDWATATGQQILVPTLVDGGVSRGQCGGTPTAVNLNFLDRRCALFIPSSSSFIVARLSGPHSRPTAIRKSGSNRNQTWDLWVCSQELWQPDHSVGPMTFSKTN